MKGKQLLIGFAALALTAGGGVSANEIYKWVDEDGNVHYEDRPSGAPTEQRLAMSYRSTDSGAVQQRVEALAERQVARQDARTAAEAQAQSAEDARAQIEENRKRCESYRAQLQTMLQARRLYKQDADGERQYLDEVQRQEARTRAEELIAEHCSS